MHCAHKGLQLCRLWAKLFIVFIKGVKLLILSWIYAHFTASGHEWVQLHSWWVAALTRIAFLLISLFYFAFVSWPKSGRSKNFFAGVFCLLIKWPNLSEWILIAGSDFRKFDKLPVDLINFLFFSGVSSFTARPSQMLFQLIQGRNVLDNLNNQSARKLLKFHSAIKRDWVFKSPENSIPI